MRAFAVAWADRAIVQDLLAQIGWFQNIALLEKVESRGTRLRYAQQTVKAELTAATAARLPPSLTQFGQI